MSGPDSLNLKRLYQQVLEQRTSVFDTLLLGLPNGEWSEEDILPDLTRLDPRLLSPLQEEYSLSSAAA